MSYREGVKGNLEHVFPCIRMFFIFIYAVYQSAMYGNNIQGQFDLSVLAVYYYFHYTGVVIQKFFRRQTLFLDFHVLQRLECVRAKAN